MEGNGWGLGEASTHPWCPPPRRASTRPQAVLEKSRRIVFHLHRHVHVDGRVSPATTERPMPFWRVRRLGLHSAPARHSSSTPGGSLYVDHDTSSAGRGLGNDETDRIGIGYRAAVGRHGRRQRRVQTKERRRRVPLGLRQRAAHHPRAARHADGAAAGSAIERSAAPRPAPGQAAAPAAAPRPGLFGSGFGGTDAGAADRRPHRDAARWRSRRLRRLSRPHAPARPTGTRHHARDALSRGDGRVPRPPFRPAGGACGPTSAGRTGRLASPVATASWAPWAAASPAGLAAASAVGRAPPTPSTRMTRSASSRATSTRSSACFRRRRPPSRQAIRTR